MISQNGIVKISLNQVVKNKNIFFFIAKIIIAVSLLIFIFGKVNPAHLIESVKKANFVYIMISFMLTGVNLFLQFKKWELTCRNLLHEHDKKKILYSLFAGLSAGAFTPARVGEYFGRALEFKEKPLLKVAFSTFIDKFFALIIIVFSGSVSSILFLHFYYQVVPYITVSLFLTLFIIFSLIFYFLINPLKIYPFFERLINGKKKFGAVREMIEEFKNVESNYSLKMIAYSFFFCSIYILQFALLVIAFSNKARLIHFLWAGNLVMFVKTVIPSISLAEIGIREGASIFFLGMMGEASAVAFDASIFLLFINVLIPGLIGLYFLFKREPAGENQSGFLKNLKDENE